MAKKKKELRYSRYELILEKIKALHLPLLTLDQKWYRMFPGKRPSIIQEIEEEVNDALKRQGAIKEEKRNLNQLKKQLMDMIVANMNAAEDSLEFRKMEKSRDLISEINDKLILLENEELDIPDLLKQKNAELAFVTMEVFYSDIADDLEQIAELEQWIKHTRNELKKRIAIYDEKVKQTKNITAYFDRLLGQDITHMYINYVNDIDDEFEISDYGDYDEEEEL